MTNDAVNKLYNAVLGKFHNHHNSNAFTVAISGIDASGKGFIAASLKRLLEKKNLDIALLSIDDWQMPKSISFLKENAAENFYFNSIRWNAFFNSLLIPFQNSRSINIMANLFDIKNDSVYRKQFKFAKVDIIMVEGIFLLAKDTKAFFDYTVWIDCSFETGLKRALKRNQEDLSEQQLLNDYQTCYYPAQKFYLEKDKPLTIADFIFNNNS